MFITPERRGRTPRWGRRTRTPRRAREPSEPATGAHASLDSLCSRVLGMARRYAAKLFCTALQAAQRASSSPRASCTREQRDPVTDEPRRGSEGSRAFDAGVLSVVPIVVSFLVFQAWMNIERHRARHRGVREAGACPRGESRLSSELGAFSEDTQLLAWPCRGALRNPDVAYVIVMPGRTGSWPTAAGRSPSWRSPREGPTDRAQSRHVEHAGQRFIESCLHRVRGDADSR